MVGSSELVGTSLVGAVGTSLVEVEAEVEVDFEKEEEEDKVKVKEVKEVEDGSHDELMAAKGAYYNLYSQQEGAK